MPGFDIKSNEDRQNEYVKFLLENADKEKAKYVCWYIARDYDKLWDILSENKVDSLFLKWKDTGLFNGEGKERKSFTSWKQYYKRTIKK